MGARFRDVVKALKKRGIEVSKPNKGSHYKARDSTGKLYPIPAGNGANTEIDDCYIKGVCRAFDLDEKDFQADL